MKALLGLCVAIAACSAAIADEDHRVNPLLMEVRKRPDKFVAPAGLRKLMATEFKDRLAPCVADPGYQLKSAEEFFAAKQIKLSRDGSLTYLVFPTRGCPGFFGASAAPIWIVRRGSDGAYALIFDTDGHGLRIYETETNGLRDIAALYRDEPGYSYRFNGKRYE